MYDCDKNYLIDQVNEITDHRYKFQQVEDLFNKRAATELSKCSTIYRNQFSYFTNFQITSKNNKEADITQNFKQIYFRLFNYSSINKPFLVKVMERFTAGINYDRQKSEYNEEKQQLLQETCKRWDDRISEERYSDLGIEIPRERDNNQIKVRINNQLLRQIKEEITIQNIKLQQILGRQYYGHFIYLKLYQPFVDRFDTLYPQDPELYDRTLENLLFFYNCYQRSQECYQFDYFTLQNSILNQIEKQNLLLRAIPDNENQKFLKENSFTYSTTYFGSQKQT